jgi:transposase-like protein
MDSETRRRLLWVQLYQQTANAGLVCRRCGTSRPTLRKWVRRFHEAGRQVSSLAVAAPCGHPIGVFREGETVDSQYKMWSGLTIDFRLEVKVRDNRTIP